ncbi:MAG: PilZ domain-containing protein [Pseudomonadota bacterium]
MKEKDTGRERRRQPRQDKRVQFKLGTEDFDIATETLNLSSIGAYCQVNKPIPVMTSLKMLLALPYGDKEGECEYVECRGVVVRVEKVVPQSAGSDAYDIAIYFNDIDESVKKKIWHFLERD